MSAPDGPLRSLRAGEMLVGCAPARLVIHGLGSCVAVFLYDAERRIGGLAHVLLPGPPPPSDGRPGRYACSAVAAILDDSLRLGARRAALLAKVTGGSRMFSFDGDAERPGIGDRNVASVLAALRDSQIRVAASDVGGERGRTVVADLGDGSLLIRTVRGEPRVL